MCDCFIYLIEIFLVYEELLFALSRYEDQVKKEHATLIVARAQLENEISKLQTEKETIESNLRKVR